MTLLDRLTGCARLWTEATGRTLGALSTIVMNSGKFFEGIEERGAGANTATLEKFARYLAEPVNWPNGQVPDEAVQFAHVCGIAPSLPNASLLEADSAGAGAGSAGKAGKSSPGAVAA